MTPTEEGVVGFPSVREIAPYLIAIIVAQVGVVTYLSFFAAT